MKTFNHVIFSTVIIFVSFLFSFLLIFHSVSNAASVVSLNSFLKAATLIGSEYIVARNGKILNNSASEDINDGEMGTISVKPDYSSVIVDALGGSGPNLNDLVSTARDFDVSNLSQEELAKFNAMLLADDHLSGENVFYKCCTVNGMTVFWAVNQAGEWIGDSIQNLGVRFNVDNADITTSLDNVLNQHYAYNDICWSQSWTSSQVDDFNNRYIYSCYFSTPFMLYGYNHYLYGVYVKDDWDPSANIRITRPSDNSVETSNALNNSYSLIQNEFTINNITYQARRLMTADSHTIWTQNNFSSLQEIQDYIQANGFVSDVIYADTIDLTDNDGYTVPDVVDDLVPISDIYYAIQNLEDGLTGVCDDVNGLVDGLTIGLDGTLLEAIEQAISDAISKGFAITDEQSGGSGGSSEDPDYNTDIPIGYWPSFFPDLLPDDMFSMFKPIFDIVGSTYSMYGIWILIPSILIFILVLYILISLF